MPHFVPREVDAHSDMLPWFENDHKARPSFWVDELHTIWNLKSIIPVLNPP